MECCWDFIPCLGADMSMNILMCLDDPSDVARVCSVSSLWRQFVIENGLSKHLCLKMFPEISKFTHEIELKSMLDPVEVRPESSSKWEILERDHKVYAFLCRGLTSYVRKDCISEPVSASSTDNFPEESIQNTLEPSDRVGERASYWSSQGESDPSVPETLLYKLISNFCVVTEVNVQPFQAYFQFGFPIYSAKALRFRMGHFRSSVVQSESTVVREASLDDFVWTYTSPVFPMAQENHLQKFKLPEPVLCIGAKSCVLFIIVCEFLFLSFIQIYNYKFVIYRDMAKLLVAMIVVALAIISSPVYADPDSLQDVCVADKTSAVKVNGFPCKATFNETDFFFNGLANPGLTNNTYGSKVTQANVEQIPGLNTLSVQMARIDFAPGGQNPPHTHPRATELIFVLEGELDVGFITTSNVLISKSIKKGDIFTFPKGLVHYQKNYGKNPAAVLSAFNSQLAGTQSIALTLFTSMPTVPDDVLAQAFQVGTGTVENIKTGLTPKK